jgi:hypothetical protein
MRTVRQTIEEYQYFSGRASETARFLAVAGLGFVWVLSGGTLKGLRWDLLLVALLLLAALIADAAHYLETSRRLSKLVDKLGDRPRARQADGALVRRPRGFLDVSDTLYRAKAILAIGAYVGLAMAITFRLLEF